MAWEQLDSLLGYNLAKLSGNYDITGTGGNMSGNFLSLGNTPASQTNPTGTTTKTWDLATNCRITTKISNSPYDTLESWGYVNIGGTWKSVGGQTVGGVSSRNISVDVVIFINRDIQKAFTCSVIYRNGITFYSGYADYINKEETSVFYNVIMGLIPPEYTWQSVPSIIGKNGILSLVTLDSESINDGEPVSGAAVSVFDQAPSNDNNIKNLADTYGGGEESSVVDVTVKYKVTLPPGGSFSTLKIVAKKDSIPEDVTDGDKIVDISPSKTKKTVTGLDENSLYYFKIFGEDTNSNTSESDEKHITTSGDEGWTFDYTGQIQTFVAPKTGIYQLETWGAQGGDATDGTLTARGGYGAYAYGEVLLQQGDTLYINVGGQNGYGGGGNFIPQDLSYIENVNNVWIRGYNSQPAINFFDTYEYTFRQGYGNFPVVSILGKPEEHTFTYSDLSGHRTSEAAMQTTPALELNAYNCIVTITVTETNESVAVEYSDNYTNTNLMQFFSSTDYRFNLNYGSISSYTSAIAVGGGSWTASLYNQSSFNDLASAIEYIYTHFTNINLIVNGTRWISARS